MSATTLVDELNRVSFIAEDFATYQSEAIAFYQANYPNDFNDLAATNLGNALINQLAFAMQALSFMINRRASELFLDTARLNSSIVKLARMLGYPIAPASPASTNLNIVFSNAPYTVPISIPTGFQWQGPGSVIYEYVGIAPAVLSVGQTSITIPVVEGQTKIVNFISDGTANQQFSLYGIPDGLNLYSGMTVTVDGTAWTALGMITYEQSNIYEVLYVDDPPLIRFGDNIAGNIPPINSTVSAQYRCGYGKSGSIGSNQISAPVMNLVFNGVTIPMTLTNPTSDVGEDPEDIEHVKIFASSFFRTQNAAVIKDDYDTIAELQSGVVLADAQIIRGIDSDITIQGAFSSMVSGLTLVEQAVSGIYAASVSGVDALGVEGEGDLFISGVSGLDVGGINFIGVSGLQYVGADVSGNVTGIGFVGVSGTAGLQVIGQSGLIISGISGLSVSGADQLGVENQVGINQMALSGAELVAGAISSLSGYLSVAFSDTSQANQVQVIVLSVDQNNTYISPQLTVLQAVQSKLQSLADAVVTVVAVDGSSRVIPVQIAVTVGLSPTAVQADVENLGLQSLIQTSSPYGLLVRRSAGVSLYLSDVSSAVLGANASGDIQFINVVILSPTNLLDSNGNLIIDIQQIIQNAPGLVSVNAIGRVINKQFIPFPT